MLMSNSVEALIPPTRLVADTRADFRRSALEHVSAAAARGDSRISIDLSGTTEIDASGLGILLFVNTRAREHGLTTHLMHVPQSVRGLLELTKLSHIFAEVSS